MENEKFDRKVYSHDSDVVGGIERDVVHLRDEDGGDRHEERGAVHVDGGADRKDELTDPPINAGLLKTLEVDWQSSRSGISWYMAT